MKGLRKSTALHVKLSRSDRALLRKAAAQRTRALRKPITQTDILRDGGLDYAARIVAEVQPEPAEVLAPALTGTDG